MAQYIPLDQTDVEQSPNNEKANPPPPSRRWPSLLLNILTYLLALYGLINLAFQIYTHIPLPPKTSNPTPNSCSCGTTAQEALSRGCKFDPFALAWLPSSCRDDALITEFTALGKSHNHNWDFYTWPNASRKLDLTEVSMGADVVGTQNRSAVTTTVDWHHTHCLYLWRKLYRSRYTGVTMEKRYDSEHHQKHCVESILEWVRQQQPEAGRLIGGSVVDLYE
ncbi:hypothetical protein P170DRAFT_438294 [Aspergillus steynii IBT 23096]|uniref:Uncharacterized protein n=1 Tax=Aspergillus steynii IBT 23096 TaxID=1392250 RepID=A0A2I2G0Z1_9EURO|nr:uncharacterized protein P170DRAFT_438294 [Aspergillus steynii IBT 23096]PLB46542.1 hypothetical protein P170DRAFT_438294 [Aspergillus steynii IBT 23096]